MVDELRELRDVASGDALGVEGLNCRRAPCCRQREGDRRRTRVVSRTGARRCVERAPGIDLKPTSSSSSSSNLTLTGRLVKAVLDVCDLILNVSERSAASCVDRNECVCGLLDDLAVEDERSRFSEEERFRRSPFAELEIPSDPTRQLRLR